MADTLGVIFAIIAPILWGAGAYFSKKPTREIGTLNTLIQAAAIAFIILIPFGYPALLELNQTTVLPALGVTFLQIVAAILFLKAVEVAPISAVEPLIALEVPTAAILSYFVFQEKIGANTAVLLAFITLGVLVIGSSKFDKKMKNALILAGLSGILYGCAQFSTKIGTLAIGAVGLSTLVAAFSLVAGIVGLFASKEKISKPNPSAIASGLGNILGWVAFAFAVESIPLSIASGIGAAYPAVAMFLGITLDREKINLRQTIAATVIVLCAILLSAQISL